jgi:hypothetical protein
MAASRKHLTAVAVLFLGAFLVGRRQHLALTGARDGGRKLVPVDTELVGGKERQPSYPFVSGDGFRALCELRCEDDGSPPAGRRSSLCNFEGADVAAGDCVYVATTDISSLTTTSAYLRAFEQQRPHIRNPYVLITHNGDMCTRGLPTVIAVCGRG